MENIYFISADRLKEDTVISETTDNKLVNPVILMVQDIYIQTVLGTALYGEIKTQIKDNTVSVLNKKLLDSYLQITIKYYCLAELSNPLTYRYMNNAAWADNKQEANPEQLDQIRNYYLNHAEWYAKRVVKYLQQNHTSYPLWLEGNVTMDAIRPKTNTYQTGMYLGNPRNSGFSGLFIDESEDNC
ncbi:MAG TPA: hypothetical protein VEC12_04715 [Bacteroidia bacterium]|nr:hypothetical protein [Bacteroidia bacterium]